MNLDFLKEFSKIYNLDFSVVLEELIKLIKKELNAQSVFFKGGRLYESYVNLDGVYKERKIKLTTKKIKDLIEKLKDRLIYLSNQNIKQKILKKFPDRVVEGKIVAENYLAYIIKINNCKYESYLYKNSKNRKRKWSINEKGIFHIKKIKTEKNGIVKIILDENSPKIREHIINSICVGYYIKKVKFTKKKIYIKTFPELDDITKEKIELFFKKKVIKD